MKRILVIGCSGGGKSTLSLELSRLLKIPVIHLDAHYWKPNWEKTERAEWNRKVEELSAQEHWIMDGTFTSSLHIRLPKADKIILLKQPRWLCLFRAIKRIFKYDRIRRRPDMAEGCDEKFDVEFYRYIWTYNSRVLPRIEEIIRNNGREKDVISLYSDKDARNFLQKL